MYPIREYNSKGGDVRFTTNSEPILKEARLPKEQLEKDLYSAAFNSASCTQLKNEQRV